MLPDNVLHDDPVERDVSAGEDFLIQQLGLHEVIKSILVFRLDLGEDTLICLFPHLLYIIHMFPDSI